MPGAPRRWLCRCCSGGPASSAGSRHAARNAKPGEASAVTVESWPKQRECDRPRRSSGRVPCLAWMAWRFLRLSGPRPGDPPAGAALLSERMAGSRPGRIWGLVAGHAASRGGHVTAADVCAAAVAAVEVSGAWLSAATGAEAGHLIQVTGDVSEQLAELELTLGEGPCTDVFASGGPTLASDLGETETAGRWPVFTPAARQAGAGAIFAFPLRIGAIRAGVMGLYRERPGPLSAAQLGDALIFADTATLLLLDLPGQAAGGPPAGSGPGEPPLDLPSPRRDRSGHRNAHRAARRRHHGGLCPATCLRIRS